MSIYRFLLGLALVSATACDVGADLAVGPDAGVDDPAATTATDPRDAGAPAPIIALASGRYTCGGGLTTYYVRSDSGLTGAGVRCVRWYRYRATDLRDSIAWYGEGAWSGYGYAHVGQGVATTSSAFVYTGQAADLYAGANGTSTAGAASGLAISFANDLSWATVRGAWNETWVRAPDVAYVPAGGVVTCGPKLHQYRAYSPDSRTDGQGLRCMLGLTGVWYGQGSWGSNKYAHLGYVRNGGTAAGADDLCKPGTFCGSASFGSITLSSRYYTGTGWGYDVFGAWREQWLDSSARYAVRIHAMRVSNDNGTQTTSITPQQILNWVNRANTVYASVGLQFLFIAEEGGPDLETVRSTALYMVNNQGPSAAAATAAASFAAPIRSKAVVFFRAGAGGGYSSSQLGYAVMPAFATETVCGHQNLDIFAHELGHYLGLAHTFNADYATNQAAADALTAANGNTSVFDGDGMIGTVPDPFTRENDCKGRTTITLPGYNPIATAATNIMSYYDYPTKTVVTSQVGVVKATLYVRGFDK